MRMIGILMIGIVMAMALPAHAANTESASELLGRRNPYRPLIAPQRGLEALPELPNAPMQTTVPSIPSRVHAAPVSVLERLEYVGIAYDESEAIAAVSDGERTWFVRKGDRLEGASVSAITPHKLTWTRKGQAIVKHLRREGVY